MIWWIKVRRISTVLLPALGVFTVLVAAIHDVSASLPSLTTGSKQVALTMLVPVVVVSCLMVCLESRLPGPESLGVRRVVLMDVVLTVATVVMAAIVAIVVGALADSQDATAAGRNTAFLTGLMLCARGIAGSPGVMAPVGWLVMVILVGRRPGSVDAYPWTILPEPAGAWHAAVGAVLMFIAGLGVQLFVTRSARTLQ